MGLGDECIFLNFKITGIVLNTDIKENMAEYGITWMYFPDGDEIPRKISLVFKEHNTRRFNMFLESDDIEYRLYTR